MSIDVMSGGWWDSADPEVGLPPSVAALVENQRRFKCSAYFLRARSDPWPLPANEVDVILIDGDHSREGCLTDWRNARRYARRAVLIHDVDNVHAGVAEAFHSEIVSDAAWQKAEQVGSMVLMVPR